MVSSFREEDANQFDQFLRAETSPGDGELEASMEIQWKRKEGECKVLR